ncbi:MAG: TolC family protein, partial [Tannerella sp.]|nr:TolC family protein [Tannerella sp.]
MILLAAGISLLSSAQTSMTIEEALNIAEANSPTLIRSKLNLERYQLNLVAQRASLKSRFSLNLDPVNYSKTRRFDNRLSQWYTNETFNSSGTFQVSQPILLTDGEISLINTFGWQDNQSTVEGIDNKNKAFSNDLYLRLTQPIFTYNRRKMELRQIEYDYENADISYALQRLNTERSITNQFYAV